MRGSTNDLTQIYDPVVPEGQHNTVWDRVCSQDLDESPLVRYVSDEAMHRLFYTYEP